MEIQIDKMKKTRRQKKKKKHKISPISNSCFLTEGLRLVSFHGKTVALCDINRKCVSCVTVFGIVAAHIVFSGTRPLLPSWATPSLTGIPSTFSPQRLDFFNWDVTQKYSLAPSVTSSLAFCICADLQRMEHRLIQCKKKKRKTTRTPKSNEFRNE